MISVSHLTALDTPPEDFIDFAALAGFEGVGLRIFPPKHAPDQWPIVGDRQRTADLKSRADDRGIRIFEAESFGVDEAFDIDRIEPALDTAAQLGAAFIVSGGIDADEDRLVANYAKLARSAELRGLRMAIEFMPSRPMKTLADAVRVLQKVDHQNACLLIDILHFFRSGSRLTELDGLTPEMIGYIHLCDGAFDAPPLAEWTRESRAGRLNPEEGGLPLREFFSALPAGVPISLEAPHAFHAHLPAAERLKRAGARTISFMRSVRSI